MKHSPRLYTFLFSRLRVSFTLKVLFAHVTFWCVLLSLNLAQPERREFFAEAWSGMPRFFITLAIVELVVQFVSTRWRMLIAIYATQVAVTTWFFWKAIAEGEGMWAFIGPILITADPESLMDLFIETIGRPRPFVLGLVALTYRLVGIGAWWGLLTTLLSWHRKSDPATMTERPFVQLLSTEGFKNLSAMSSAICFVSLVMCFGSLSRKQSFCFDYLIMEGWALSLAYGYALHDVNAVSNRDLRQRTP